MTKIDELIAIQESYGYHHGVSATALLGLAGEAGEVLNETAMSISFQGTPEDERERVRGDFWNLTQNVQQFEHTALYLDNFKKLIRNGWDAKSNLTVGIPDGAAFDKELADSFYYNLALALGRGLTIEDLANLCLQKIASKQAQNV